MTQVIACQYDIEWLPKPNEVRLVLSSVLPPGEAITTAFALAFRGDQLLLSNLKWRGWDIPGGHRERGESLEETVRREVHEETAVRLGPLELLGYQHMRLLCPRPDDYSYPHPDSYQVFYWAHVASQDEFEETEESSGGGLFAPPEARVMAWVQGNAPLYEAALAKAVR